MPSFYKQGETIKYFLDGRLPNGNLATSSDNVGVTATGQLQKTKSGGSDEPDQDAAIHSFTVTVVPEQSDSGAGFELTLPATVTLALEPGTYVFEGTVTFPDDTKVKEHDLVTISASVQ